MINKTVLVGRLTRDPEVKMTDKGVSVVNFTLAVNRQFNKEQTDFIRCVAWKNSADFLGNYIKKGASLGIDGRIETGSYEDYDTGKKINTYTVVAESVQALEPRGRREKQNESVQTQSFQTPDHHYQEENEVSNLDIRSDDLPF